MQIWAIKNNQTTPTEMLKLGEFDSRIDKDLLAGKILEVCGAMTPVHNTTDSYTYYHELFFKMWSKQITKLLDTMDIEYETLENYRRVEDLTHESGEITSTTDKNDFTSSGSESANSSSTAEQKTSAYNESVYQPQNQDTVTGNESKSNNNDSSSERKVDRTRDYNTKENRVIKGMNGLFTPQQLIQQERDLAQYNVYQWIVSKYMEELFICVF